jgi:hypothetical protein
VSAPAVNGETVVESIFPPRLKSSKTKPETRGVTSWIDSIVLSVASGNTIEALSELVPADSSIVGPAFTFQLVLLAGPRESMGGKDLPATSVLSRALSRQASTISSGTKTLLRTTERAAIELNLPVTSSSVESKYAVLRLYAYLSGRFSGIEFLMCDL